MMTDKLQRWLEMAARAKVPPVAEAAKPVQPIAKEPWMITRGELVELAKAEEKRQKLWRRFNKSPGRGGGFYLPPAPNTETLLAHRSIVKQALSEGKPVPPEVLKDYPELVAELAITEGNPLRKFCCRQCGECAPPKLLEEGRFPDRIAWLRSHYKAKHPAMWQKHSAVIPSKEPTIQRRY